VFGYRSFVEAPGPAYPDGGAVARRDTRPAVRAPAPKPAPARGKPGPSSKTVEENLTEKLIEELLAAQRGDRDAGGNLPMDEEAARADAGNVIDALAQYYEARSRRTARDLRTQVEELKKKGREVVPDLLKILKGSGSDASKVIAAGVLGAINADIQDPEISRILTDDVIPMLKGIVDGASDRRLKAQAVSALGDIKEPASVTVLGEIVKSGDRGTTWSAIRALGSIGTESAQQVLTEVATDEGAGRTRMLASRTLGRTGTVDTAYRLLPSLQNPESDSELLTIASCVAQINARVKDQMVGEQLAGIVPKLEEMIRAEGDPRRESWMVLGTLSSIGTDESNRVLVGIIDGEGVNEGLRRSAMWAAAGSGGPELATQLGELLRTETDSSRQIELASAIGSIANRNADSSAAALSESQALPTLHVLALTGESVEVQRRAISAIGRVGDKNDIEALKTAGESNSSLRSDVDDAVRNIERRTEGGRSGMWFGGGRRFRGR
jgi:HEAT repeat protein